MSWQFIPGCHDLFGGCMLNILEIETNQREEIVDITGMTQRMAQKQGWTDGALHLFCQHTTCGLTINENADPDVRRDLMRFFQAIAPQSNAWRHAEGNSDAHIRSSLLGASLLIPISNGKLCLGCWQSIYLYEGDGPRKRNVLIQLLQ